VLKYIARRTFYTLITLWVIASLTFLLMKALPGDPFHDPKMKPDVKQALMEKYGLNKPVMQQYGIYLNNLIHGDLGTSIKFPGRSVTTIIKTSFPKSFALGWRAMLVATILGIFFGLVSALNHGKWLDYILTAKSKGITKVQIVLKHIIRNAIMPVVTVLGPLFAGII
jgi:oligopeptide transport system permease protein